MNNVIVTLCVAALLGTLATGCSESAPPETAGETEASQATKLQATTSATTPAITPATYSAEAFFATTSYGLPAGAGRAFSPDGRKLLVTSDQTGIFNAYAVDIATGNFSSLTASNTNANRAVSYFPADERVLFTADKGGDELNHVWVREVDGSVADLTNSDNTKAMFAGWSSDGSHFYVLSNERDPAAFDLYAYASDAAAKPRYAREMIYQNDQAMSIDAMSPDGRWIALSKPRTSADSNVYLVETSFNSEPRLITPHQGNIAYGNFDFTPDSAQLIISTNEHGEWNQAWAYDIASGSMKPYLSADWDVSFIGFSSTGKFRFSGINQDASTVVSITSTGSGAALSLPALPAGDLQNVRFAGDDTQMAFVLNADTIPSDVYVLDLGSKAVKRLTKALNPAINPVDLVEASVVRYESFDGTLIPSILYKPHQASPAHKVPALVFVHGGPGGQTRRGYNALFQHLVNHGYAVLGANNRGSSGYGKTFNHMDDKRHGKEDLQDIVWGRTYLESLDWVDGERIGIIGGSYGGFMVAAALAFEPDAFNVGIDIFGVTNWVRTLKSIPPWWESMKESLYDEMGDPATDEERHASISPLFHAANIKKPLLVIQGANDPRVLQVESDELVAAVNANNVPVEYVVFPDEGHGFQNRQNRITASDAYVRFLDTYLK